MSGWTELRNVRLSLTLRVKVTTYQSIEIRCTAGGTRFMDGRLPARKSVSLGRWEVRESRQWPAGAVVHETGNLNLATFLLVAQALGGPITLLLLRNLPN